MVTLLELFFFVRYQADSERSFRERGIAIARQLGPAIEYALFSGSYDTLLMLADGMRKGDAQIVSVSVLDKTGKLLALSGNPVQSPLLLNGEMEIRDGRTVTTVQVPILQTAVPFADDAGVWATPAPVKPAIAGYSIVVISRAELAARQKEMLEVTLAIMLGGLLLASWLSFRIAGSVLAQLDAASNELRRQKEAAELLARTDELTGLPNRRAFYEAANHEIQRALRYGVPLTLVLTDIDHFKSINDNYGHHVGDAVLQAFARSLSASIREVDLAGRWGGEEFVILMPNTSLEEALQVAERMRLAVAGTPMRAGRHSFGYTTSFGVATFSTDVPTLDALLSRADEALYRAKERGRNRIEIG
jgi:diguanylate cyclase (GGDEF)-like protein